MLAQDRLVAIRAGRNHVYRRADQFLDPFEVTARVAKITEKTSKSGPLWFADVEYEYRNEASGELALRETTRIIERG